MPPRSEMAGQDFAPVSFGTKKPTQTPSQKVAANGQKFPGSSMTSSGMSAAQLDAETDELKHQTVSKDLRIALQKARQAKGLSQKQLAQQARAAPLSRQRHAHARPICTCVAHCARVARPQLNMAPQVINEYESGKAIPNNGVIARIEKALGAKLPRAQKKK